MPHEYLVIATSMRALRLFALILSMGICVFWGDSVRRVLRPRATDAAILGQAHSGRDREINRAIWVGGSFAVFLFQVRWLTPWLPELALMRVWLLALTIIIGALLAAVYHHGRSHDGFDWRRVARIHAAMFAVCVAFALMSA